MGWIRKHEGDQKMVICGRPGSGHSSSGTPDHRPVIRNVTGDDGIGDGIDAILGAHVCGTCNLAFETKKGLKGHYIKGLCPRSPEAREIFAEDLTDLLAELETSDDDHP
jgi:hypothetical protein